MKKETMLIFILIIIVVIIFFGWVIGNKGKNENQVMQNNIANNETQANDNINQVVDDNNETQVTDDDEFQAINPDFEFILTENFDIEKLKSYNLPIIIGFGSEDCPPCKRMEPDLKTLNHELQGKAIIRKIDAWEHPELAEGYNTEEIPMQIFINSDGTPFEPENASELGLKYETDENGKHTLTYHVGVLTLEQMKDMLNEMGLK